MAKRPIHRLSSNGTKAEFDELADEVVITILDQDKTIVRILGTPLNLPDLAIGHIVAEGRGSVDSICVQGHMIHVSGEIVPRPTDDLLTASCGACSTGQIESPSIHVKNTVKLTTDTLSLVNTMQQNQVLFSKTGGVHGAAVFTENGELVVCREDIGRHNALDKSIGACLLMEVQPKIVVMSSRIGWELVAKSIRSGIELLIAIGSISSAAEELARTSGMTLVGFAASKKPAVVGDLSRILHKP